MAGDAGTSPNVRYIFVGVADFICLLMAAESLNALQYKRALVWLVAGVASFLIGYHWPRIQSKFRRSSGERQVEEQFAPTDTGASPASHTVPHSREDHQPTLLDLFKKDFSNTLRSSDQEDAIKFQRPDGASLNIRRQVYMDFPAMAKFAGFYIPMPPPPLNLSGDMTFNACLALIKADAVQQAFDHVASQVAIASGRDGQMTRIQDLTFSGRVLIYHEEFLSIYQKADILKAGEAKGMGIQFMGMDYLGTQVAAWHRQQGMDGAPRLLCTGVSSHKGAITVYEDDMTSSPLVSTARVIGRPIFYHLKIANEPTGTVDRKVAEKIAGRVQIFHENGTPAARERLHRWENSPGPKEAGKSADQLVAIDIPPNGVECNLDIAMKYEEEDSFYTPNNETAMRHGQSGWGGEDFKFPPGTYMAKVYLSGTNTVTDLRCQIVNKGVGSKLEITPL